MGLLIPLSPFSTLGLLSVLTVIGLLFRIRIRGTRRAVHQPMTKVEWAIVAALVLVFVVILGHVTYYPFIGDDTLNRYGVTAQQLIALERFNGFNGDGYPAWLPVTIATFLQFELSFNEQLAKLIPLLFASLTVLMTFALAERWFNRQTAWIATLVLTTTPLFIIWSGFAYLDIPTALYFLIAAYAIDVWIDKQRWGWAALAGVSVGLAMWIKQSGLAILPSLGVIMLWQLVTRFDRKNLNITWHIIADGIVVLAMSMLFGGWWYVRNALIYGDWQSALATPPAYYTAQSARLFQQLVPFVSHYVEFGYFNAALYIIGCLGILWLWRQRNIWHVWLWIFPFLMLWWFNFSYDARFLVTILPFYAILAAVVLCDLVKRITWPTTAQWGLIASCILLALMGIYQSRLGGLRQWVQQPTATYAERVTRAKGDLYPTIEYLRDLPDNSDIFVTDSRMRYYFPDRFIEFYYPNNHAEIADAGYDFFVVGSWIPGFYASLGNDAALIAQLDDRDLFGEPWVAPSGGLRVYPVLTP